ncbi:unnamed protein product [Rotaria sordida]|uniref:RING-type domain-containing protein n=1 Tax=Rotaria sordida TaxID=392033 RepID=A0A819GQK7_9BILA|nr:unnamed protein product [Rotaria sordida]
MCHFCHRLNKNPQAPAHRSSECLDKANSFSHKPMHKRIYENGKRIQKTNSDDMTCVKKSNSDDMTCVICMEQLRNMTFIPCGHVSTCEVCASNLKYFNKQELYFAN